MNNKIIIVSARALSILFTPFYLPLVGLTILFTCTYLKMLPALYIIHILLATYFFTVLLPTITIFFYRHYHGWTLFELGKKEKRAIPYLISIACYVICYEFMINFRTPHLIYGIIIAALAVQIACATINIWWKISTHTAAIGGVTGALVGYSFVLGFNPVWWLCLSLLISGLLGTARMILRQHSLSQVTVGFLVGFACAALSIHLS